MTFDAVTFTARTLTRLIRLSRELFEDADPSAGDVISRSFAAQIALGEAAVQRRTRTNGDARRRTPRAQAREARRGDPRAVDYGGSAGSTRPAASRVPVARPDRVPVVSAGRGAGSYRRVIL
jgi:hypothetical protein